MQFVAIGSLILTCGEEELSERRCDRTQLVGVASRGATQYAIAVVYTTITIFVLVTT